MHAQLVLQHIYDQLNFNYERRQLINQLTCKLIKEQHIQNGDCLYLYLGQTKRCHNTQAIQRWIEKILDDINTGDDTETYQQLKHRFLQLMPEMQ